MTGLAPHPRRNRNEDGARTRRTPVARQASLDAHGCPDLAQVSAQVGGSGEAVQMNLRIHQPTCVPIQRLTGKGGEDDGMAGPPVQAERRLAGPRDEAEPDAGLAWGREETRSATGGQVMPGIPHRREQRQGGSDVGPMRYDEDLIVA